MTRPGPRSRLPARPGSAGYAAAEFVLGICLIVVPVTLLVLSLPVWSERQAMAQRAADESARKVVLAPSWDEGVLAGRRVVAEVSRNYGLAPGTLRVEFEGALQRGATVTSRVTVTMPVLAIPLVGRAAAWHWTAVHVEHVDSYRSL